MIQIIPEYLSAKQAAQYIGIAYITLKRDYRGWDKHGVHPMRYNGKLSTGKLRFKRSELDALMNAWRITKGA